MGCGASTDTAPQKQQKKPVASVYPRQQQDQGNAEQTTNNQDQQNTPQNSPSPTKTEMKPLKEDETDIEMKHVDMNEATLRRYVELEQMIRVEEAKNTLKNLHAKAGELEELSDTVQKLEAEYQKCVKQTAKEKADVDNMQQPSVRSFFKDQASFDAKMSKEQEEYLEALNKQEIAKKELDGAKKQKGTLSAEVNALTKEGEKLNAIYTEQDELLASIFNGKYGSEREYQLESQLDVLLDRKQRIAVAKYKWSNARVLLQHACNQLAFAVKRWTDLGKVNQQNTQMKYTIATEARNNLVAAGQNIASAQRYLHTIQFPYCKPEEVVTLNRATSNIYTDMQTPDRYKHAAECYSVTHRRAAALVQWFDSVINNTINKDIEKGAKDLATKEKELREERLRLIKEKIKETTGKDVNISVKDEKVPETSEEQMASAIEADQVSVAGDLPTGEETNAETGEAVGGALVVAASEPSAPTPLPLNELAPPPSENDIFGNIDDLKKQHEKEMEEFNKAQELNKARMDQGLQEKLRARRSRRRRQEEHEQEAAQLKK